jgi:hypothetical protein
MSLILIYLLLCLIPATEVIFDWKVLIALCIIRAIYSALVGFFKGLIYKLVEEARKQIKK